VTVRSLVGALVWQVHFGHDLADDAVIFENAPGGEQRESPGLRVERPSTREFFVFNIWWADIVLLVQSPSLEMAAGIGQVIAVWLRFAQRHAVDDPLVTDQPKEGSQ
jgi:hypothetical protein